MTGTSIVLSGILIVTHSRVAATVTYNWFKGSSTTPFRINDIVYVHNFTSTSTDYISGNFSVTTSLSGCTTSENSDADSGKHHHPCHIDRGAGQWNREAIVKGRS